MHLTYLYFIIKSININVQVCKMETDSRVIDIIIQKYLCVLFNIWQLIRNRFICALILAYLILHPDKGWYFISMFTSVNIKWDCAIVQIFKNYINTFDVLALFYQLQFPFEGKIGLGKSFSIYRYDPFCVLCIVKWGFELWRCVY